MFPIDERTIEQAQQAASKMVPVQEVGRSIKFDYKKGLLCLQTEKPKK